MRAGLAASMVTPGSTEPDASFTTPAIDCAAAGCGNAEHMAVSAKYQIQRCFPPINSRRPCATCIAFPPVRPKKSRVHWTIGGTGTQYRERGRAYSESPARECGSNDEDIHRRCRRRPARAWPSRRGTGAGPSAHRLLGELVDRVERDAPWFHLHDRAGPRGLSVDRRSVWLVPVRRRPLLGCVRAWAFAAALVSG